MIRRGLAVIAAMLLVSAAQAADTDWRGDAPGKMHRISAADLPAPYFTKSGFNPPHIVPRPAGAVPAAPPDAAVSLFTDKLEAPRLIRIAPNGDIFVAETNAGQVRAIRATDDGAKPAEIETFARGLTGPFGIAFYPPGPEPQFVYIAVRDGVLRFPYRNGDLTARGTPEALISGLWSGGGHSTRDVAFSPDGKRMFVSVGSQTNDAEGIAGKSPMQILAFEKSHALGALWGGEENRADVLAFTPDGKNMRIYATGIRNCVSLPINPADGAVWCTTNERDGLGDNLPPDYATSVRAGAFYGWPWYYIGDHPDPRHPNARNELAGRITVPDVLIQPHSAPLQGTFYEGAMFPDLRGSLLVALHGSWNRATRTGGKIIRVVLKDGKPTGEYQDFLTGFIVSNTEVWGRPVGIAVDRHGAILVGEDGNNTIWRVTRK